jgi:hypothetical protein
MDAEVDESIDAGADDRGRRWRQAVEPGYQR